VAGDAYPAGQCPRSPSGMGVSRQAIVRVLQDAVMSLAPLPVGVHVHGDAPDVRHVMKEPVADLLGDRVRFGDGPW
jgi:hypothetical protein